MNRKRLPNRRLHETFEVEHWSQKFIVGIGRDNYHSPITEIFIHANKTGTQAETLAVDSAVLLSIALQYGAPFSALRDAVSRDSNGNPTGPIGKILDAIGGDTNADDLERRSDRVHEEVDGGQSIDG
jgi:HAMP domain-containing protein